MNFNLFLSFFTLLPLLPITSDHLPSKDYLFNALWEAGDFSAAEKIYLEDLERPLSDWQKERIFYNVGSIQLALGDFASALKYFQKVIPSNLLLEQYGRSLYLNSAVAYFRIAKTALYSSPPFMDLQILFIQEGQKALDTAQKMDCNVQEKEEEKNKEFCEPSFLISDWINKAASQLSSSVLKRNEKWIENAGPRKLSEFLQIQLERWQNRLNSVKSIQKDDNALKTLSTYFLDQGRSLIPLWEALKKKELGAAQKKTLLDAFEEYSQSLEHLKNNQPEKAVILCKKTIETLSELSFQQQKMLRRILLNLETILLQESFSVSLIKNILDDFDAFIAGKEQIKSLIQIKKHLLQAQEKYQISKKIEARFFLLAAFSSFNEFLQRKELTSREILQEAIESQSRALQLFIIHQMTAIETADIKEINAILEEQQALVIKIAQAFIPSVLKEQKKRFQEAKTLATATQISWDLVIPLFDKGLRYAKKGDKKFKKKSTHPNDIIALQEQTLKNWQHALELILNPPPLPISQHENKTFSETYNLLNEMFLQDQSKKDMKAMEMHTW